MIFVNSFNNIQPVGTLCIRVHPHRFSIYLIIYSLYFLFLTLLEFQDLHVFCENLPLHFFPVADTMPCRPVLIQVSLE